MSPKPFQLCDKKSVSGAYCSQPQPPLDDVATLCKCQLKSDGSQYNDCTPFKPSSDTGNGSAFVPCNNKFGCQSPLFPSMLGRRILAPNSIYSLTTDLCRCNGGSNYGLDVKTLFCRKYSKLYQRTSDPGGYYTPSTRWFFAQNEYDYYAQEIFEDLLSSLLSKQNTSVTALSTYKSYEKNTTAYKDATDAVALLNQKVKVYATPIKEFACSIVYPRCARCDEVLQNPNTFFNGNENAMSCFDPTTCRSLCIRVLDLDDSFPMQLKKCLIAGTCSNSTRSNVLPYGLQTEKGQLLLEELDIENICHSELVCPFRSFPGARQYDNPVDFRSNAYDVDPFGQSISNLTVFGIVVASLTVLGWVMYRVQMDIWKQRREFGATEELRSDRGSGVVRKKSYESGGGGGGEVGKSEAEEVNESVGVGVGGIEEEKNTLSNT